MSDCRFGVSPVNYLDPDPRLLCRWTVQEFQRIWKSIFHKKFLDSDTPTMTAETLYCQLPCRQLSVHMRRCGYICAVGTHRMFSYTVGGLLCCEFIINRTTAERQLVYSQLR